MKIFTILRSCALVSYIYIFGRFQQTQMPRLQLHAPLHSNYSIGVDLLCVLASRPPRHKANQRQPCTITPNVLRLKGRATSFAPGRLQSNAVHFFLSFHLQPEKGKERIAKLIQCLSVIVPEGAGIQAISAGGRNFPGGGDVMLMLIGRYVVRVLSVCFTQTRDKCETMAHNYLLPGFKTTIIKRVHLVSQSGAHKEPNSKRNVQMAGVFCF